MSQNAYHSVCFLPLYHHHHTTKKTVHAIQIPSTVLSNPKGPKILGLHEADADKLLWFWQEGEGFYVTFDGAMDTATTTFCSIQGELLRWNQTFLDRTDTDEVFQIWGYSGDMIYPKNFSPILKQYYRSVTSIIAHVEQLIPEVWDDPLQVTDLMVAYYQAPAKIRQHVATDATSHLTT